MFQIAVGVCLGVLAAVTVLNWWAGRAARRDYKRGMELLHPQTKDASCEVEPSEFGGMGLLILFGGLVTVMFILAAAGFSQPPAAAPSAAESVSVCAKYGDFLRRTGAEGCEQAKPISAPPKLPVWTLRG